MNASQGFPAENCTVTRCSMIFTSTISGFDVMLDRCISELSLYVKKVVDKNILFVHFSVETKGRTVFQRLKISFLPSGKVL